ncbi:hypothetical protein F5883DRAFT_438963, partial [Diaporthe sp. PMI_573]
AMQRPIIFIAHNLGGTILKRALIYSDAAQQNTKSIKLLTLGIFFMGTPHQGKNIRLDKLPTNSIYHNNPPNDWDSDWHQEQQAQWARISSSFITKCVYEGYPTVTTLGKITVVPRTSAVDLGQPNTEPICMHSDHVNMVKFLSKEDTGYVTISEYLQIMLNRVRAGTQTMEVCAKYFKAIRKA